MHHPDPALKAVIEACDRAISQEDYDTLMGYYAEDAALVVKPGMVVRGKENIRKAFIAIADYFQHRLIVTHGKMEVIEGGGIVSRGGSQGEALAQGADGDGTIRARP